jgi:TatD DNase family protein
VTALVDTHAHLDLPEFDADREAVFERARAAGVRAIVLIGYDPERWRTTERLCASHPWLVRAVGLHPNSASLWSPALHASLRAELDRGDAVAIGEIGLDFFREHAAPELQRAAFAAQLALARERDMPIIIHQRNAEHETLDMLAPFAPVRGVMHCFSGDSAFAERCLALGLSLGVGGVLTYRKSEAVRAAIASAPLERLVLETDAPFLAPQSRRGQRNESALMIEAQQLVAELQQVSPDEVARRTTDNAVDLFGPRLAGAVAWQPK